MDAQDESLEESFNEQPPHLRRSSPTEQHGHTGISVHHQPAEISDDQLRESIRSLNEKQHQAYDIVLSWCRDKMKNLNCMKAKKVEPIYLFITGGGGAGKSHLIKTIYHTVIKTFRYGGMNPENPTVLLSVPTGVAAVNINGTTINTPLAIPKNTGDTLPAMSKKNPNETIIIRIKLLVIDEISIVSNTSLHHIHQRLKEIFATSDSQLFAGLSVIALGDLYQLPPIQRKPVFEDYKNDALNLYHPWHVFKMIELTEIMRQKDDQPFIEQLNRFRTGSQTNEDIQCIQSRSTCPLDDNYPTDSLLIWAENNPVTQHNNAKLKQIQDHYFN